MLRACPSDLRSGRIGCFEFSFSFSFRVRPSPYNPSRSKPREIRLTRAQEFARPFTSGCTTDSRIDSMRFWVKNKHAFRSVELCVCDREPEFKNGKTSYIVRVSQKKNLHDSKTDSSSTCRDNRIYYSIRCKRKKCPRTQNGRMIELKVWKKKIRLTIVNAPKNSAINRFRDYTRFTRIRGTRSWTVLQG